MNCPERQSSTYEGYFNAMTSLRIPKVAQPPRPITLSTPAKKEEPQSPRPMTETKPIVKPTVISTTDLVGQILLQGFGSTSKQSECPQTSVSTVPTVVPITRTIKVDTFFKDSMKDTKKLTVPGTLISTATQRAAPSSISWDMNKVLTPRGAEKRQHDMQVEQAHAEIKAKRQRLSQWLGVSIIIINFNLAIITSLYVCKSISVK